MKFLKQYLYNLALGVDQMANVVFLGDPDESFSGRIGRAMLSGKPKWFVPYLEKLVDWFFSTIFKEDAHCHNAVEPEEAPHEKELWRWSK
jgi:hypothetical protein